MIITAIEEYKKGRYKVFIDEEFAFVLYKGELKSYKIELGSSINENAYREILDVILPKRAKLRAMNLLKSHMYSEKMLKDKLLESGHTNENADIAVEYVKSFKYVDDEEYARQYLMSRIHSKSKQILRNNLLDKGIAPDVFDKIYLEFLEDDSTDPEEEVIKKIVGKKLKGRSFELLEKNEKDKIIRHLMSKGFSYEKVKKMLYLISEG